VGRWSDNSKCLGIGTPQFAIRLLTLAATIIKNKLPLYRPLGSAVVIILIDSIF
jgi:hypothetical protein